MHLSILQTNTLADEDEKECEILFCNSYAEQYGSLKLSVRKNARRCGSTLPSLFPYPVATNVENRHCL